MKRKSPKSGFGKRLYESRTPPFALREITHSEIAARLRVSRVAVTKWENNVDPAIKPANLFALADLLGVRARWLACHDGPQRAQTMDEAFRLASDWITLPPQYQAAVRKHLDALMDVTRSIPELNNWLTDERVRQFILPAPGELGVIAARTVNEPPPTEEYSASAKARQQATATKK